LRHNLRNELTVARGVAGIAVEGETPPPSVAADSEESTEDLLTLGEKAREVERRMEAARIHDEPVGLTAVVESIVAGGREEFPDATVEDEGPGIPDHEREVIESGTETTLEHGSGLGLWVAKWGAMRLGGEVRFRDVGRGTAVEIRLPGPPE
jgi:signal transduction histidine kinase